MNYDKSVITKRSMPFWCVENPLGDPFGGAVLPKIDSLEAADILAWAGREGLIEATSFHDDDLVPWDPMNPEDDLDSSSPVFQKIHVLKKKMDEAGIEFHAATCSLHGHPMFRDGGLCNPDPEIRRLARLKVERTLRLGQFFGCKYYVYWVARDGFEVPVVTDWNHVYDWLADGLNHATDYIRENGMTNYLGATIEPKPNEPRGQMFLPTSGHAVGFILGKLVHPDFWGVNPELLQHESMVLMNAVMTVGYLCSMKKLKFLHLGSQIKAQFDNDFPPLVGPEGLKETVFLFHALKKIGWKGVVEFDCHMLRSEGSPENALQARRDFIVHCVTALQIAADLAERIREPVPGLSQTAADIAGIMQLCELEKVNIKRG